MKTILKNHSAQKPKENFKILTKAKFEDQSNNVSAKISKCGSPKCGICYNIIEGYKFQFKNGPLFEVKTNMDCSSKNFLYVIKCERCGEDYIGETGNELRKRMTVHRQQIRDPRKLIIRFDLVVPIHQEYMDYQKFINMVHH